jgi:transcriptional regulator with XRE-family HTH domain
MYPEYRISEIIAGMGANQGHFVADRDAGTSVAVGLKEEDGERGVGGRIRMFRQLRKLTLKQVADAARITESYLSQIERGSATGSVDALSRIAGAVGLTLSDLFTADAPAHKIVRRDERPAIASDGVAKSLLTLRPLRSLEVMEAILDPGASIGDASHTHGDSQELLLALEGGVTCTVDAVDYDLAEGDCIEYSSSIPHSVANPTSALARVLYVISPPSI